MKSPQLHQVKICGITLLDQCEEVSSYGFGAIGFILYPPSPRAVSPEKAAAMAKNLPVFTNSYAVVVNESIESIYAIQKIHQFTKFQLHGEEPPEYCCRLDELQIPWVKVFRVNQDFNETILAEYPSKTFFLDTYSKESYGGTGYSFDWKVAKKAAEKYRIILAGGLSSENIREAAEFCSPAGFDLSSGLEEKPGVKNLAKVRKLYELLR